MLITASINIFGKVHKRPLEDRQSFSNVSYAKLVAKCLRQRNVCGTAKDLPWPRVYFRAATGSRTSKRVSGVIRCGCCLARLRHFKLRDECFCPYRCRPSLIWSQLFLLSSYVI